MKKNILFCDNHLQFLETRAEYLERAGYNVIKAVTVEAARHALDHANIHMAVLDVHMINDRDPMDNSGLQIAFDPDLRYIPTIILTDKPNVDGVRDVLKPGKSSAIDYVGKNEGAEQMIEVVKDAFEKHILINWNLIIRWDKESGLSIPGLIGILEMGALVNEFSTLNEEVEDLLRTAFREYREVLVLRKLWVKNDRIALLVMARNVRSDRVFVLTFGGVKAVRAENDQHENFPDEQGEGGTTFVSSFRRAHFAVNLWRLWGVKMDELEPLSEAAEPLKDSQLINVFEGLVTNALGAWRSQHDAREAFGSVANFYQDRMALCQSPDGRSIFARRVEEIGREARRFNLVRSLSLADGRLKIDLGSRAVIDLPDPSSWLFDLQDCPPDQVYYMENSPGGLSLETLLVVPNSGVTWLTDFIHAGEYPAWHDFAQLETELRFKLIDPANLGELYDMECQVRPAWPEETHDGINGSGEKRKYGNAVLRLRALALKTIQQDSSQYAQCLLFSAASVLMGEETPSMDNRKEIARLVHRLLLVGLVCDDLETKDAAPSRQSLPALAVNEAEGTVKRGGKILDLSATEYRLLCYLNQNSGKTCTREDICHDVFDIKGAPDYNQIHGQIDANLNRLRDKIEPGCKTSHYIITDHGRGIRLVIDPAAIPLT